MSVPTDRKYLKSHEWHKPEGDLIVIGITQFAADELTDITYVSLPKVGTEVGANGRFGEIESVKATSDLYTGMSGTVVAINDELSSSPGLVNTDPFNAGWMIKIKPSAKSDYDALLAADVYLKETGH